MLGAVTTIDLERFRAKARQFLREHEDDPAIHKLRFNEPLGADDVEALEQMLLKAGTPAEIEEAKAMSDGLGLFIRSLVGLEPRGGEAGLRGLPEQQDSGREPD